MVQPRKEQLKNLKTKYKKFTSVGNLFLSGGPTQTIFNTGIESYYDELLLSTLTQIVDGAAESSPAYLYGGSGPWTLVAGNSFSVTIPGVNSGSPVTIDITASEIVTINGGPKVTTSRLVDRINTILSSYSVATNVAFNEEGRLKLVAADTSGIIYGDSASIVLTDITPGILSVLGLTTSTSVSSSGVSGPKRGMVTVSADTYGGYVQLKTYQNELVRPLSLGAVADQTESYGWDKNFPSLPPGGPAYARIRAFPGPVLNGRNFEINYFRNGTRSPSIITGQSTPSDFTSVIAGSETIDITVDLGNGVVYPLSSISLNSPNVTITSVDDLVDNINYTVNAILLLFSGKPTLAGCKFNNFPHQFEDVGSGAHFFLKFNGGALIPISLNSGVRYSAVDFYNFIDNEIILSGELGAVASNFDSLVFAFTVETNGLGTVEVYPGSLTSTTTPDDYMSALNMLGLSPGKYNSFYVCKKYGEDEIEFTIPSNLEGASITVSGSPTTMAKFGLPTSSNANTTVGPIRVSVPAVSAFLPEVVEFSEEPDDNESRVLSFQNSIDGNFSKVLGTDGSGLSAILGPDGKIDQRSIPRILDHLGLATLKLGYQDSRIYNSGIPKLQTAEDGTYERYSLIWESVSTDDTVPVIRLFTFEGTMMLSVNAIISYPTYNWTRDSGSFGSTLFELSPNGVVTIGYQNSASWANTAWNRGAQFNLSGAVQNIHSKSFLNSLLKVGEGLTSTLAQREIPRVTFDHGDSVGLTLLFETSDVSIGKIRLYAWNTGTNINMIFTANASWNSTTSMWVQDNNTYSSFRMVFGSSDFYIQRVPSGTGTFSATSWVKIISNDTWSSTTGISVPTWLALGGTATSAPSLSYDVERIRTLPDSGASTRRTLLWHIPDVGSNLNYGIRLYADSASAFRGQGFTIVMNAVWDNSTEMWSKDDAAYKSYLFTIGSGTSYLKSSSAGAGDWDDDSWYDLTNLDVNGSVIVNAGGGSNFNFKSSISDQIYVNILAGVPERFGSDPEKTKWYVNGHIWQTVNMADAQGRRFLRIPLPTIPGGCTITNVGIKVWQTAPQAIQANRMYAFLTEKQSTGFENTSPIVYKNSSSGNETIFLGSSTFWTNFLVSKTSTYTVSVFPSIADNSDRVEIVSVSYLNIGPRNS